MKRDLSGVQLQGIGAVTIAWNEVEFLLDQMLYSGLGLPGNSWLDVVTRLSVEGKIELIDSAIDLHRLTPNMVEVFKKSLATLRELKEVRNSVVHARVFDAPSGIGENIRRRGKISQVLLTQAALDALYERLVMLRAELRKMLAIFDLVRTSGFAIRNPPGTDPSAAIPEVKEALDALLKFQKQRVNLGPLPGFSK